MSEQFIGEIRMVGFSFPPKGWAFCDGATLSIAQNQALFSLLGTTYGGNGQTTFNLPDLRGRVAVHAGSGVALGQQGGEANHTLVLGEMAAHNHPLMGAAAPQDNSRGLDGNYIGSSSTANQFSPGPANATLNAGTVGQAGQSQPHNNMQPSLVVPFCIALVGIFPSRN